MKKEEEGRINWEMRMDDGKVDDVILINFLKGGSAQHQQSQHYHQQ